VLYHCYVNEVGLLDQVPLLVVIVEPTTTEEPGIEGSTKFTGAGGRTTIGLLVAGALLPPALVAITLHVIVKPISPGDTVVYEEAV
jgi:hypothetical protein